MLKCIEVIAAREGITPEEVRSAMEEALVAVGLNVDPEDLITGVALLLAQN